MERKNIVDYLSVRKLVRNMQIKDIQQLIDNPLQPNLAEWAMDVKDVLSETGTATKEKDKITILS